MSAGHIFMIAGVALALACVSAVLAIAVAKVGRGRLTARSRAVLAPYRHSLIAVVAGEDDDGRGLAALCTVPASVWVRLRPSVIAFLPKVRGLPADSLCQVLRVHGELEEANRMLTSRRAVCRAQGAYLLGLVRDPRGARMVLPLLGDSSADVRLVAARALGAIGDPAGASGVLRALRSQHGQIGLPAWIAAEALLSMGREIGSELRIGLTSEDPAVRNVCAVVAGHGTFHSAAAQLRVLLATDSDADVRVSSAVALGRIGGAQDAALLAAHTRASEPAPLRRTCATALGDLGQGGSLDALAGLLADDDRRLAERAADSLVRIGSEGIALLDVAATALQGLGALAAIGALELVGLRGQVAVGEVASS